MKQAFDSSNYGLTNMRMMIHNEAYRDSINPVFKDFKSLETKESQLHRAESEIQFLRHLGGKDRLSDIRSHSKT